MRAASGLGVRRLDAAFKRNKLRLGAALRNGGHAAGYFDLPGAK